MKVGDKYIQRLWFSNMEDNEVVEILGFGSDWVCYKFDDGSISGDTVEEFLRTCEYVTPEVKVGQVYQNNLEQLEVRFVENGYAWCARSGYYGTYTVRDLLSMRRVK